MLARRLRLQNPNRKMDTSLKKDMIKEHANAKVISKFNNKLSTNAFAT